MMEQGRTYISLLLYAALALLAAAVVGLNQQLDYRYPDTTAAEDLKYLPAGKFLKGAALSYDEVAADLLWIKAIGYFGGHARTDRDYTWLYHILDITTTLDPLYSDPYEFGGIVFATELNDADKSIAILKKGMRNIPKHNKRYWYQPFFLAFNYMYYKGDNLTAARYLERASRFPQRPEYLPLLVARLYANTDDPAIAIPFLEEMIKRTESPAAKERLRTRIKEVTVERDIRLLEAAKDRFVTRYKRHPEELEELVATGFIKAIPTEPFGGIYYISIDDHKIYSTGSERLKIHVDRGKSLKVEQEEIERLETGR